MLKNIIKRKDVRNKVLFVLFSVIILRIGAHLPVPFIDTTLIKEYFTNNNVDGFSLMNIFTGGSLENFSIFSLSITPYITASIIIQLLGITFPRLEEIQKDDLEKKTYNRILKITTVVLSIIQSIGLVITFSRNGLLKMNVLTFLTVVISFTAGTMFLIWLGDEITTRGIGNGISMILMLNIISRIPNDLYGLYEMFIKNVDVVYMILRIAIILAIILFTILMVIILDGAERKIPITTAKKSYNGSNKSMSNIPIKVNIAGVVPVIFASTLLSIPVMIAAFIHKQGVWTNYFSQGQWFNPTTMKYTIGYLVYAVLIIFFAYFYTNITFNPIEVSNNLKKQGSMIPGIRPGNSTINYLTSIVNPLIFIGTTWLLFIITIPIIANGTTNASVSFGGTSIIIVVGVIVESITQLESSLINYEKRSFLSF